MPPVGGHLGPAKLAQAHEDTGQRAGRNSAHHHRKVTQPDGEPGGQDRELHEALHEAPDQGAVGTFLGYAHVVQLVGASGQERRGQEEDGDQGIVPGLAHTRAEPARDGDQQARAEQGERGDGQQA